jgi:hypothetical protein
MNLRSSLTNGYVDHSFSWILWRGYSKDKNRSKLWKIVEKFEKCVMIVHLERQNKNILMKSCPTEARPLERDYKIDISIIKKECFGGSKS